ncbi:MAG: ATP-binding protein [Thermodesulfovibrionia bacterium]|nr:ATP-binding protein [Thermodesulfovibrionia bacterium]
MNQNIYKKLKTQWNIAKTNIEIADIAFVILRIVVLVGGCAWIIFSDISEETVRYVSGLFIYFAIGSACIFISLFLFPHKEKTIYAVSLFFDLSFVTLLVNMTGGFESPFSNGFYLMTALYSFYYGAFTGILVATLSIMLYLVGGNFDFAKLLHWTDFFIRAAFLFLLAAPLGMLSEKLKKGKEKLENINKELQGSMESLRSLQGRVVQAEKLAAVGRLTADVAHEIRNPLTSIGGFARRLNKKLLEDEKEKEKEREYTELIISEVNRLERILRDVLAFSREAKFNLKRQEINGVVKESLKTFGDICNEQSIEIKEDLDTSLPLILIEKDQVRQAVNNLISNAVDVMPKGGILKINTFMKELYNVNFIVVEVADTGIGIPKEKLDMIFEPFYTTKEIGKGSGLGLSLCKKIIDEHCGLITVESELSKGSSFKLFFPYQCEEEEKKIKCWEFNKCDVEKAEGAAEMRCAAYPHYGRICWVVAGTFCGKRVTGAIAQKLGDCKKCKFYQRVVVRKDL